MTKININNSNRYTNDYNLNKKSEKKDKNNKSIENNLAVKVKKDNPINNKITYTELSTKNMKTVALLKKDMEKSYSNLKKLINDLILKQNSLNKKTTNPRKEVSVNAKKEIQEGGRFSPENLSDNIVDFAKNISGGNKSKFKELKNAIIKGFKEAEKILGGELPEISNKTYDLVMEKMEDWKSS